MCNIVVVLITRKLVATEKEMTNENQMILKRKVSVLSGQGGQYCDVTFLRRNGIKHSRRKLFFQK